MNFPAWKISREKRGDHSGDVPCLLPLLGEFQDAIKPLKLQRRGGFCRWGARVGPFFQRLCGGVERWDVDPALEVGAGLDEEFPAGGGGPFETIRLLRGGGEDAQGYGGRPMLRRMKTLAVEGVVIAGSEKPAAVAESASGPA